MVFQGYLCFVLHAHLPFIRHPEHPDFIEEDWLYEANSETYIPLILMMERLAQEKIPFRLTMSLTPPLCEMMVDPLLQNRYLAKLEGLIRLCETEARSHGPQSPFHQVTHMYLNRFRECRDCFLRYNKNLVQAFAALQYAGNLEIITCGATHGLLPLMSSDNARRAQLRVARENYRKHFQCDPRGIWLPECAYVPGIEKLVHEVGIDYFLLDSHGLVLGTPTPRCGVYRPIYAPNGTAAFGRDPESSRQVWSSKEGYPGDADYREFYRDLGYDAGYEFIRPHLHSDGIRRNIGLKYHRITGQVPLHMKEAYRPDWAWNKTQSHAANFMFNRQHQIKHLKGVLGVEPIVICPYDAELFGHWWFEGPWFLENLFRQIGTQQSEIALITPPEFMDLHPENQVVRPAASSWGDKGFYEVWLNASNDWIYRHLHIAEKRMQDLCHRFPQADGLTRRALNQAGRELLLAQSSDWAFIMTTGTMVPYAERRTRDHLHNFNGIFLQIVEGRLEEPWITQLESRNSIFQEIDYHAWW